MRHGRRENGHLLALYDDLVKFGIARRFILAAIDEGEARGFIEVEHGLRLGNGKRQPSRFRLTYYEHRTVDPKTKVETWFPPTDEWRRYRDVRDTTGKGNFLDMSKGELNSVYKGELGSPLSHCNRSNGQVYKGELGFEGKNAPSDEAEAPAKLPKTKFTKVNLACQVYKGELPIHIPGGERVAEHDMSGAIRAGGGAAPDRACRFYVVTDAGYHLCGRPVAPGNQWCDEHAHRANGSGG